MKTTADFDVKAFSEVTALEVLSENMDISTGSTSRSARNKLRIHSVNVGAGSCHLIECPNSNAVIVVDCGTRDETTRARGPREVEAYGDEVFSDAEITVVVTHPDGDHFKLVPALMGGRLPSAVFIGGDPDKYYGSFVGWLADVQDQGVDVVGEFPIGFAASGLPYSGIQCGTASTYVLTVNVGDSDNANSLALLVEEGGFKAMFPGDAEGETQQSIIENYGALTKNIDVLMAPHHGSSTHSSNNRAWASHVRPKQVVYSAGLLSRHPKCSTRRNYRPYLESGNAKATWCNVDSDGSTEVESTTKQEFSTELLGAIEMTLSVGGFTTTCEKGC